MKNLLKLEWKKSSSFRNTSASLIVLILVFLSITQVLHLNNAGLFAVTMGLIFAAVILTVLGSLLYLKNDFDQRAPLTIILPFSGREIVLAKFITFLANILLISLLALATLFIYTEVIRLTEGKIELDVINFLQKLISFAYKNPVSMFFNIVTGILATCLYGGLIFTSILYVRSKQNQTGSLKWLFIFLVITFLSIMLLEIINQTIPIYFDLKNFNFGILDWRYLRNEFEYYSFPFLPTISNQEIISLGPNFNTDAKSAEYLMIIPTLLTAFLSFLSLSFCVDLIDKKIDF